MSNVPPCSNPVLFYIVPANEAAVPVCKVHTGDAMENLILRGCTSNGWAYKPLNKDVDMGPCHGPLAGKIAHMAMPAPMPAPPPPAAAAPEAPKKRRRA
jgi:hypothetical protein